MDIFAVSNLTYLNTNPEVEPLTVAEGLNFLLDIMEDSTSFHCFPTVSSLTKLTSYLSRTIL